MENVPVARSLSKLSEPYTIFSPGLAGIARHENYISDGVLLRTIARGDANLVFRNVLLRLTSADDPSSWNNFQEDIQKLFPGIGIEIQFENETDEFVLAYANLANIRVPVELAGTGILQSVQILAYVHYFRPSVILLDEPDSHLHPNNQRLLCKLLQTVAEERETQVFLTTHSRHVVDALSGQAGFPMDDTIVLPYYGCTSPHNLRPLIELIRGSNSSARIVVHQDRDYLTDGEGSDWETSIRNLHASPFLTDGVDIESYFLNPNHLASLSNSLTAEEFEELINEATQNTKDTSIEKYINGRSNIAKKTGTYGRLNIGQLAAEAPRSFDAHPTTLRHSKTVVRELRRLFQEQQGRNLRIVENSENLSIQGLSEIANRI